MQGLSIQNPHLALLYTKGQTSLDYPADDDKANFGMSTV